MIETTIGRTIHISGVVQGVGFRPFVYRLAHRHGLMGWVRNTPAGVEIAVDGCPAGVDAFAAELAATPPPLARIESLWSDDRPANGFTRFDILPSRPAGAAGQWVSPDIALCDDCRREMEDPGNRRHRYPFINCTHCGPRYSIIDALPYDRPSTTMAAFPLCPACQAEYDDPLDRRFHAQPIACPTCGPQLSLWDENGATLARRDEALRAAAAALHRGEIVAVKGLGGFHLMVAAPDEAAVARLRRRKHREAKPFALLYPNLAAVRAHCRVSDLEARWLTSPEAPIVLLDRRPDPQDRPPRPAAAVAPGNPCLGVMLASNPLHHLLLDEVGIPLVATSGNRSGEPLCTGEDEALEQLAGIADLFLVHNRPIARHVDDSILRVVLGREMLLRRARGFAPLPVELPGDLGENGPLLAVGAHQKNSVVLARGCHAFTGQHVGDLDTAAACAALERTAVDLARLYEITPAAVACDRHPDYHSTRLAEKQGRPLHHVQHHHAHILACLADNRLAGRALGVAWDGTGLGPDGTIWGGEFLLVDGPHCDRVAHLRPFPLPGGDQAVREPRRSALGLLFAHGGPDGLARGDLPFSPNELAVLKAMLTRGLNTPLTSSAGRLFDAVASLAGLRHRARFEGEAAMELEFALPPNPPEDAYPLPLVDRPGAPPVLDWGELLEQLLADRQAGVPIGLISTRFHRALVAATLAVARRSGEPRVALSGGCFQNRFLLTETILALQAAGFDVCWHRQVPPNDGGIALGQVMAALPIFSTELETPNRSRRPSCAWPFPEK